MRAAVLCFTLSSLLVPFLSFADPLDDALKSYGARKTPAPELLAAVDAGGGALQQALLAKLTPPATGGDVAVRYMARHYTHHVARPESAGALRLRWAAALAEAAVAATDPDVQGFLLRELALVGTPAEVPALAGLISPENPATLPVINTLVAIGQAYPAKGVDRALRPALKTCTGKNLIGVVQGLGRLQSSAAAETLLKIPGGDPLLEKALRHSLAQIGDPSTLKAFTAMVKEETLMKRSVGADVLLYAARLQGRKGTALCEKMIATCRAPELGYLHANALRTLYEINPAAAADPLLKALDHNDISLRIAAANVLAKDTAAAQAKALVKKLESSAYPAELLDLLGRRGDAVAFPAAAARLADANEAVRLAAAKAMGAIDPAKAFAPLTAQLAQATGGEADVLRAMMARLSSDDKLLAEQIQKATDPASLAALIELTGLRGARKLMGEVWKATEHADRGVQSKAWAALRILAGRDDLPRVLEGLVRTDDSKRRKQLTGLVVDLCRTIPDENERSSAVLPYWRVAVGETRTTLLQALGAMGGPGALQALLKDTTHSDTAVRDAAYRVLGKWTEPAGASDLLAAAIATQEEAQHVLALRAYLRLVNAKYPADAKSGKIPAAARSSYQRGEEAARRDAERKAFREKLDAIK